MVAAFSHATRDSACQIHPPKFVLTRHSRDHAVAETAAGACAWHQPRAGGQCLLDVRRFSGDGGNAFERGWVSGETITIGHYGENVFARAEQTERLGARSGKDCDAGAVRHIAAGKFAYGGIPPESPGFGSIIEARRYFFPSDAFEAWLSLREVKVRAEAKWSREAVAWGTCNIPGVGQPLRAIVLNGWQAGPITGPREARTGCSRRAPHNVSLHGSGRQVSSARLHFLIPPER